MPFSLIPPSLPSDFCNLTSQEQANLLIGGTTVSGTVDAAIVFSVTEPGVDQRDLAWGKLNVDGTFGGKIFVYDDGYWGSEHPYTPSGDLRMIWAGIEADVWSFDGGDGTDPSAFVPTNYTGAMWQVDTVFAGRSPMGVGSISGADPAKSLALAEQYGQGSVTLTNEQTFAMQSHKHVTGRKRNLNKDTWLTVIGDTIQPYDGASSLLGGPVSNDAESQGNAALSTASGEYAITSEPYNAETGELISPDSNESHQNVHPVVGIYIIKRTARKFYTP